MRIQQQTKNNFFKWRNRNNEIIKLRPLTLYATAAKRLEKEILQGSYAFEKLLSLSFITDDTSTHNTVLAHKHKYIVFEPK